MNFDLILYKYHQFFLLGAKITAKIPPITIIELPTTSRQPNGSSVSILELITPTIISERKSIEHKPAPSWLGDQRITIPVGIKQKTEIINKNEDIEINASNAGIGPRYSANIKPAKILNIVP